jgi:hypothetical protein
MSGAEVAHTEASEEAGVDGIVAADPVDSYEYVKDRGQRFARRVTRKSIHLRSPISG